MVSVNENKHGYCMGVLPWNLSLETKVNNNNISIMIISTVRDMKQDSL